MVPFSPLKVHRLRNSSQWIHAGKTKQTESICALRRCDRVTHSPISVNAKAIITASRSDPPSPPSPPGSGVFQCRTARFNFGTLKVERMRIHSLSVRHWNLHKRVFQNPPKRRRSSLVWQLGVTGSEWSLSFELWILNMPRCVYVWKMLRGYVI